MRMHTRYFWGLLVLLFGALSCTGPEEDPPVPPVPSNYENGVFIINEGNFLGGNASLSFLYRDFTDSIDQKIIRRASGDLPLGDVAQSLTIYDNKAWIVVNNSGEIRVVNLPGAEEHCRVTGLTSPRYLLFLSPTKAYCTDLYADAISIVDPSSCALIGSIPTGGWTEELILAGGMVYVTQMGTDKVLVIDPTTDAVTDSILVGREPNGIVEDAGGQLWVLCSGGLGEVAPSLHRIDPADNHAVTEVLVFGEVDASASRLRISPDGERLYWLYQGDVLYLDRTSAVGTEQVYIPRRGGTFYALGIDPQTGDIYVGDAFDYVRNGVLYRYTAGGTFRDEFDTGIIPGNFTFD
ncbi:MAG: YncE family protein [Bacteroidota bacterium]